MEGAERPMGWGGLFKFHRPDIRALHKTWFAFFLTFYVWFNMAPLATTIAREAGLTMEQMKVLAICNVALTIPARVIVGMISDWIGPRRTFTLIMVFMAAPALAFALGNTYTQLLISRLFLGMVGTGFVVGIHMTSLWFKPRDIGFAQGVEAGLGNWGSSIAAITMPVVALNLIGGVYGWRVSMALSAMAMLAYGIYYWFSITDGPPGTVLQKGRKTQAIEVISWKDLVNAIIWTIPLTGILATFVWKIDGMGFMGRGASYTAYAVIAAVVLYQVVQLVRINAPILSRGIPEDDRYRFSDVAALCASYAVTFGAELAVISMLPAFYEKTFSLTPQMAGLFGSLFAILNFFARALVGYISDRCPTRKLAHLIYIAGVAATLMLMAMIGPSWSVSLAVAVAMICAMFVTGGCGTTFAIVPLIKRRATGQISGYVGAYGNIGAVAYLTAFIFVTDAVFFFIIGASAAATFFFCLLLLKEPAGAFSSEYKVSSVDRELMKDASGH